MAVAYRAASAVTNGGTASLTLDIPIPSAAQALDLAIVAATSERSGTIYLPPGWTTLFQAVDGTNMNLTWGYRYLRSSDLGSTIELTQDNARYWAGGMLVLSGAAIPVVSTTGFTNAGGTSADSVAPDVTPTVGSSMLVAVHSFRTSVSPYTRTLSGDTTGYTSRVFTGSSRANINGYTHIATRLLSGGSGASQTGNTMTLSDVQFAYNAGTLVVAPGGPTADAGPDLVDIEPYSTVTLSADGSGTWSQSSGSPTVTLGGSGTTRTFEAPGTVAGTTLGFSIGGSSMSATIMPSSERIVVGGVETALKLLNVS